MLETQNTPAFKRRKPSVVIPPELSLKLFCTELSTETNLKKLRIAVVQIGALREQQQREALKAFRLNPRARHEKKFRQDLESLMSHDSEKNPMLIVKGVTRSLTGERETYTMFLKIKASA